MVEDGCINAVQKLGCLQDAVNGSREDLHPFRLRVRVLDRRSECGDEGLIGANLVANRVDGNLGGALKMLYNLRG